MLKRRRQSALRLDELQAQALAELGQYFFESRQQQGLSLEQIAASTKIQRRLLEAIERGELHRLPESVYVRGLLKRFAEALGLPGIELAKKFPLEVINPERRFFVSWGLVQLQPLHLYLLYVFLIFSAINGLSSLLPQNNSSSATANSLDSDLLELFEPDPEADLSNTQANERFFESEFWSASALKSAFPLTPFLNLDPLEQMKATQALLQKVEAPVVASTKPVQVSIQLKEQSWLKVTVDNQELFEGILSEGITRTWTADQKITIRAGNAGGVLVTFNDASPQPMGDPGAVEEVTFESAAKTLQASL